MAAPSPRSRAVPEARSPSRSGSSGVKRRARDFRQARASAVEALARVGPARARVTLAVETDDPTPFVTSEELELDKSGAGTAWTYEVPMTWPRQARRVSVLVEELRTGLFGSASTDLPH